jgi:hypothetical protein
MVLVNRGSEPAGSSNNKLLNYITDEKALWLRWRFLMEIIRNRHSLGLISSPFEDNFCLGAFKLGLISNKEL